MNKRGFILLAFVLFSSRAWGWQPEGVASPLRVIVSQEREDALYRVGETVERIQIGRAHV